MKPIAFFALKRLKVLADTSSSTQTCSDVSNGSFLGTAEETTTGTAEASFRRAIGRADSEDTSVFDYWFSASSKDCRLERISGL